MYFRYDNYMQLVFILVLCANSLSTMVLSCLINLIIILTVNVLFFFSGMFKFLGRTYVLKDYATSKEIVIS